MIEFVTEHPFLAFIVAMALWSVLSDTFSVRNGVNGKGGGISTGGGG